MIHFKDLNQKIINENVEFSVKTITDIIKKYGPRESGSKEAFAAEEELRKELEKYADVHYEEFRMAPKAFLHFTKSISSAIIATIGATGILRKTGKLSEKTLHAMIAAVTGVSLGITGGEFLLYKQISDVFYKKVTGHNMVARRMPKGEVKKRIVIAGHIDTEYEWNMTLYGKGKAMAPIMGSAIVMGIASCVIATVTAIMNAADKNNPFTKFLNKFSRVAYGITVPPMFALHNFVNFRNLSPGANDNFTGCMAAVCALRMLDQMGIEFEHTEVDCVINDGEEAGLRGSKQFAKDHYDEFVKSGIKTSIICVDTLKDLPYLNVYSRDMTGTVQNDMEISRLVMDAANDAGHKGLEYSNVYFGSSDAAAFSQKGISATCLAAMDPTPAYYYHNRRDNYDTLDRKAIKVAYDIIINSILKFADEDIELPGADKQDTEDQI